MGLLPVSGNGPTPRLHGSSPSTALRTSAGNGAHPVYWKRFVELGAGNARIDFARFLDTLESETKAHWVAAELDSTRTTPLDSAKTNHDLLVKLGRLSA